MSSSASLGRADPGGRGEAIFKGTLVLEKVWERDIAYDTLNSVEAGALSNASIEARKKIEGGDVLESREAEAEEEKEEAMKEWQHQHEATRLLKVGE